MTKEVITINEEENVEKCANLLLRHNFSGLPVLNSEGNLVGIVTEGDLIRRASRIEAPPFLEVLGGVIYLGSPQKYIDEIKKAMSQRIGELMSKKVITVSQDESVEYAATLLVNKKIKRLPVVDAEGNLVGIISRRDVMNSIYKTE